MKTFSMIVMMSAAGSLCAAPMLQNAYMSVARDGANLLLSPPDADRSISIDLPGSIQSARVVPCKDALWGAGMRLTVKHGGSSTTLSLYQNNPFAHLETHITNNGEEVRDIKTLTVTQMELNLGTEPEKLNTLGTGGLRKYNEPSGSYAYSVLADPASRNGIVCGWLTQLRGVGLMLPSFREGRHLLETRLDFGRMRIEPGQTRETDILLIGFFDDARKGLEHYADDIAKVYHISLPPKPNVYCTWYHRNLTGSGASTEKMLAENAAFAKKHLQPFGLNVFQIDDHWQAQSVSGSATGRVDNVGPVKTFKHTTQYFPAGMAAMADNLKKEGFVPGIWYMPFAGTAENPYFDQDIFYNDAETGKPFTSVRWSGACIDPTAPGAETFLRKRFKRIQDWGYRYIKVDGLHTGTPSKNIYVNRAYEGEVFADADNHDMTMTFIEGYRKGLNILREETPGTFILGCSAAQNMVSFAPVFGLIDAMRVGPDNDKARHGDWGHLMRGADFAGNLWFLNNRVWYNDPDPFYVRESNPLHKVRWMASWLAVSGAMNTSSMQYSELTPERLDIIKRTLPAHDFDAIPVDILENSRPRIWRVSNDRITVLCLLNWDEENETVIDYPFDRLGLDSQKDYEMFDFWENRYLGAATGKLTTTLKGAHCRVLALRETRNHPQLLSTSRHITQGLMDVVSEEWNPSRRQLRGTSNVVAGDPYELRIICPDGFRPSEVNVSDQQAGIPAIEQSEGLARVTITPTATGRMDWVVVF